MHMHMLPTPCFGTFCHVRIALSKSKLSMAQTRGRKGRECSCHQERALPLPLIY